MSINYQAFLKWAERKSEVNVVGDEIKINSFFAEDTKQHLWCNVKKNAFHCWKSEKSGNLVELVCLVDGCSYQEAAHELSDDNELRALEDRLDKFFSEKQVKLVPQKTEFQLNFPPFTMAIPKLGFYHRKIVEHYLSDRKIPTDKLMFCFSGNFKNRIIIPYYDNKGKLVYWNARDVTNKSKVKYMGPDAETGVGKGDVIFVSRWPEEGSKLYLTEGEFDAMSLTLCGFNGAACGGKALSDKQINLLRPYKVCVCFDTDKSGSLALNKMGDKLISSGIQEVSYVRPPADYKDWNKMFVVLDERIVNLYIAAQEKPFTPWTSNTLRLNRGTT